MESSQWENWNYHFCLTFPFLTDPRRTFRGVGQGMQQMFIPNTMLPSLNVYSKYNFIKNKAMSWSWSYGIYQLPVQAVPITTKVREKNQQGIADLWVPLTGLILHHVLCLSQARTWISNIICRSLFIFLFSMNWSEKWLFVLILINWWIFLPSLLKRNANEPMKKGCQ